MKEFVCNDYVSLDLYRYGKFCGVLFERMPIDFAYDYLDLVGWKVSIDGQTYRIHLRNFPNGCPLMAYASLYAETCRRIRSLVHVNHWASYDDCVSFGLFRYGKFRGFLLDYIPFEIAMEFLDISKGKIKIDGKTYHLETSRYNYSLNTLCSHFLEDWGR